jgi:hypothetical protein
MLMFQWKIWNMKLPLSKKISIALIMSFAGLAVAATVMRIPYILKACLHVDKPWDGMELTLWSSGELVLGILCASAPALRAFFTRKSRHILAGRLHSMQEWASRGATGASRHVTTNVDVEIGDTTLVTTTSDNNTLSGNASEKEKKVQYGRIDSVNSTTSSSSENSKISNPEEIKDILSPASWDINESPWGQNISVYAKKE